MKRSGKRKREGLRSASTQGLGAKTSKKLAIEKPKASDWELGDLEEALKTVGEWKVGEENDLRVVAQVLATLRYTPTKNMVKMAKGDAEEGGNVDSEGAKEDAFVEAFELVLSDGARRCRFLLSSELNGMVKYGAVVDLGIVCIEAISRISVIGADQRVSLVPVITKISAVRGEPTSGLLVSDISKGITWTKIQNWPEEIADLEEMESSSKKRSPLILSRPLLPGRSHFVPVSNDDCLCSSVCYAAPYSSLTAFAVRSLCEFEVKGKPGLSRHSVDEFLQLWANGANRKDIFVDSHWRDYRLEADLNLDKKEFVKNCQEILPAKEKTVQSLAKYNSYAHTPRRGAPLPTIVGVVTSKSAPTNFGCAEEGTFWPIKFWFDLEDHTGSVRVNCWGRACRVFFHVVQVGSIVEVQGGRLKSRTIPPKRIVVNTPIDLDDFEIAIDYEAVDMTDQKTQRLARHNVVRKKKHRTEYIDSDLDALEIVPKLIVLNQSDLLGLELHDRMTAQTLLDDVNFRLGVRFPDLLLWDQIESEAVTTLTQEGYSSKKRYTVVGLLTYCGRREVQVSSSGKQFEYRWIRIREVTASSEFVVQLYANAVPGFFLNMIVGEFVMLSKLAMVPQILSCRGPLSILLRSTAETSMYFESEIEEIAPNLLASLRPLTPKIDRISIEPPISGEPSASLLSPRSQNCRKTLAPEGIHDQPPTWPTSTELYLFSGNPSQEILFAKEDGDEITSSLLHARNAIPFSNRFPPMSETTVAGVKKECESLVVGETRTFVLLGKIQSSRLEQHPISEIFQLIVSIEDPSSTDSKSTGEVLETLCPRDPLFGPIPTVDALKDRKLAKKYFQFKLRGRMDDPNQEGKVLHLSRSEDGKSKFWIEVHRKSFTEVQFHLRAAFHPRVQSLSK